jgi:two-component system cell cycle response regulator
MTIVAVPLVLLASLVALGAWTVLSSSATGEDLVSEILYLGAMGVAALAVLVRARRSPQERGWMVLGAGILLWIAGDLAWGLLEEGGVVPLPSVADALYGASYVAYTIGLLQLLPRTGPRHRGMPLDGLIVAGLSVLVFVALVLGPAREAASGMSGTEFAVTIAYPIADAIVLGVVIAALGRHGWICGRREVALLAGAALMISTDSAYALGSDMGGLLDLGWMAAAGCWGIAALQPATRHDARSALPAWSVAIPLLGMFVAVVTLLIRPAGVETLVVATLITVICCVRFALTADDHRRLAAQSRSQADTDTLTGLRNRRRLMDDLAHGGSTPRTFVLFDLDGFKHYNDTFGHPAGDILLGMVAGELTRRLAGRGTAYRLGGDEFCALVEGDDDPRALGRELALAMTHTGRGFHVGASFGAVRIPEETADVTEALALADRRMYARKHARQGTVGREGDVLLAVLAEREPDLGVHVSEVAELAIAVGRQLGIATDDLGRVRIAGELHDVGKIAMPDAVLTKPGPLTEAEFDLVRRHTIIGERILSVVPAFAAVGAMVRSSHERWDGGGYPDGLAGVEIPLGSRIIFACDAFHAMTTDRCYRPAMTVEDALAELRRERGRQFDPAVVDALTAVVEADTTKRRRAIRARRGPAAVAQPPA